MTDSELRAVPLHELLRHVPITERLVIEHSPTSHSFIPVGVYCHEAATILEALCGPPGESPAASKEPPHCPTCSCGGPEFETMPKADFDALLADRDRLQAVIDGIVAPVWATDPRLPKYQAMIRYFDTRIAPAQSTKGSG